MSKFAHLVDPEKLYWSKSRGGAIKGADLTASDIDLLHEEGSLVRKGKCIRGPVGWYCKRDFHREGPCALVRKYAADHPMYNTKSIDVEAELSRMLNAEIMKSDEQRKFELHKRIDSRVEDFMKITKNNLDMLYEYLYSAYQDCRLNNVAAGQYIADKYGDDFYLRRELLRNEEYSRYILPKWESK